MSRRVLEFGRALGERGVDGGLEGGGGREGAILEAVVLERMPLRLDAVQLRAVRGQVVEGDADGLQCGQGGLDGLGVVDAVVVQHDRAGALAAVARGQRVQGRPPAGQLEDLAADEVEQGVAVELALPRQAAPVDEAGPGADGREGAEHVHPPPLGRLVAQQRTDPLARPRVAGGHRRGEAALVQVEQVVRAPRGRLRQNVKTARSARACSWRSGSALCWTVRLVRFQRNRRWRRRWARYEGRTRAPWVSASQRANCGADQVRSPRAAASSSSRSTASRCASVSRGGRPGRRPPGKTSQPDARNARAYLRPVCSCLPGDAAIFSTLQPRSDSRIISSRSRSSGATTRSRALRCSSARSSVVSATRYGLTMAGSSCPKSTTHLLSSA